jgi:response regulator RpfG family c-di-GMP phosphodiesterase
MCTPMNKCKILWVEDELQIVDVIKTYHAMYPEAGMENLFAASTEEAEKIYWENEIVIIMVDLNVIDSSGEETVKRIAAMTRERGTPFYLYTGTADHRISRAAKELGAREVFIKGELSNLNAIIISHHLANEERKTRTLKAERDTYKREKEELQKQFNELKIAFDNLVQDIPSKARIQKVERVGENIQKLQTLIAAR